MAARAFVAGVLGESCAQTEVALAAASCLTGVKFSRSFGSRSPWRKPPATADWSAGAAAESGPPGLVASPESLRAERSC
jgi:hypothetical protein